MEELLKMEQLQALLHSQQKRCDSEQQTIRNHKLILFSIFTEAISALMQMLITLDYILSL